MVEPAGRGQEPPESSGCLCPRKFTPLRSQTLLELGDGASELLFSPQHLFAKLFELLV